jgi:hypothetical protein
MQGPIRCVVIAGLLMGCDPGDTSTPDAPVGTSGLIVAWSTSPVDWPSTTNLVTLSNARFALDSLRVVGDAGPGDPRTTSTTLDLRWDKDSQPGDINFDDAPTGLYSQIALAFDGHTTTESFRIEGKMTVGSNNYDFRIEDDDPLGFNVGIDEMVMPGTTATIHLRVNFTHAIDSVNWQNVDLDGGRLELQTGDSEMAAFRAGLVESFEIVNGGGGSAR